VTVTEMDLLTDSLDLALELPSPSPAVPTVPTVATVPTSNKIYRLQKPAGSIPRDLMLRPDEKLFTEFPEPGRGELSGLGLYMPMRHYLYLESLVVFESSPLKGKDGTTAYHGQFPQCGSRLYTRCDMPICRAARNAFERSRPSYIEKHTATPRPRQQYKDTEPLIFYAQCSAYSHWIESHIRLHGADPQVRTVRDLAGNPVNFLEATRHERLMRDMFNNSVLREHLLDMQD
jgi:hypothetical protein